MSTRCYDTDLNDAAWAWIAPYLPAARRVGGHARPTCAPSLRRSFTCCEQVASGACYPARVPRPGTVYHYFRAWKEAGVLAELQRALHEQARLKPRLLALPFGGHPGQSVGQDTERGGARGFDEHKTGQGRKRHLLVDTLGMVVARRVEAANVSARGGAAACRLTIRLPEHPDGDGQCRLREPQAGARAKTASRVGDCTSPNAASAPSRWWA